MLALAQPPAPPVHAAPSPNETLEQLRRLHRALRLKSSERDCDTCEDLRGGHAPRKRVGVRETVPIYWRRLIEVGVPIDDAKEIAWAIVRYDAAKVSPSATQQQLLRCHSRFICRARLWRSELLPTALTRRSSDCSYAKAALGLTMRTASARS